MALALFVAHSRPGHVPYTGTWPSFLLLLSLKHSQSWLCCCHAHDRQRQLTKIGQKILATFHVSDALPYQPFQSGLTSSFYIGSSPRSLRLRSDCLWGLVWCENEPNNDLLWDAIARVAFLAERCRAAHPPVQLAQAAPQIAAPQNMPDQTLNAASPCPPQLLVPCIVRQTASQAAS